MMRFQKILFILGLITTSASGLQADSAMEVSQYGITWHFDKPYPVGHFVNGDWWVIGPVTVVSVTPAPTQGPLDGEVDFKEAVANDVKDLKGVMRFVGGWLPSQIADATKDTRMRNGSMVIAQFCAKQGYDSRSTTYDASCSISFPYKLDADRSLISAISQANPISENFCHKIHWRSEKKQRTLLRAAAVLTCLENEPPADAFRPPYAGTEKPIYRVGDLRWDLLHNLKLENFEDYFKKPWLNPNDPACEVATWEDFEHFFKRPWLFHYGSANGFDQVLAYMEPNENQTAATNSACFGREDSRMISVASLLLHINVPKERKEKLLIGLVQRGIDLSGAFKAGTVGRCCWIQSGCKWPILFASMMLDKPELRQFSMMVPFHEDVTTYYGTGWFGQTALWRIVYHGCLIDSCEERSPEQRIPNDGISESYRSYGSSGKAWLGTALSVRLMKAIKIWGHDAFFDYCDRWLEEDPRVTQARGMDKDGQNKKKPEWEMSTWDPFVAAMWKAYRKSAPEQEMSGKNLMAQWEHKQDGWQIKWVENPKPSAQEISEHVEAIHKAFPKAYPEMKFPTP